MTDCPPEEALIALAEGHLAGEDAARIREHADRCERCRSLLAAFAPDEPADPPAPRRHDSWAPPAAFDGFDVIRRLGVGGMGEVYLARERALDRTVALKFIRAGNPDLRTFERFMVEARAIARLQHPNVVSIFRVGEVQAHPYIAYEFVSGQSLDCISKPVTPWTLTLEIGLGIARGLAAAHERGVLHRDIKPANVILGADGAVKLLDFGLAKLNDRPRAPEDPRLRPPLEGAGPRGGGGGGGGGEGEDAAALLSAEATPKVQNSDRRLTEESAVLGTPLYLAPEMWSYGQATARSDIYAFGLILYELCAGSLPHAGLDVPTLARTVPVLDLPPLARLSPDLPAPFAELIDRCVRRLPAERFQSAREVLAALQEIDARYSPWPSRPSSPLPAGITRDLGGTRRTPPASPGETSPPPSSTGFPGICYVSSSEQEQALAYQIVGDGPVDLVLVQGWVTHLDNLWEHPAPAAFLSAMASFARLILFDQRGTGLSERDGAGASPEQRMEDLRAVLDAAGSRRAVLLGEGAGAAPCVMFAQAHPGRTMGLIAYGSAARIAAGPDAPFGQTAADLEAAERDIRSGWGRPLFLDQQAPSMARDSAFRRWWAGYLRLGATPGIAIRMLKTSARIDLRAALPEVRAPALVLHRAGDRLFPAAAGRDLSERIPGARYVELPGDDHLPYVGDTAALVEEIRRFLRELSPTQDGPRSGA